MTPQQRYYRKNKERLLKEARERYEQNIDKEHVRSRNYKEINKETIKIKRNQRLKKKRKENPSFKLRNNLSRTIRRALKNNNSSKSGMSFLNYVDYSIDELKQYLENQFDTWMSWSNWGVYNSKTWNDSDSATWTWQIDHIIPQSKLEYVSMEEENFKKCWSLSNLRPLSAKQNFINGVDLLRKK